MNKITLEIDKDTLGLIFIMICECRKRDLVPEPLLPCLNALDAQVVEIGVREGTCTVSYEDVEPTPE